MKPKTNIRLSLSRKKTHSSITMYLVSWRCLHISGRDMVDYLLISVSKPLYAHLFHTVFFIPMTDRICLWYIKRYDWTFKNWTIFIIIFNLPCVSSGMKIIFNNGRKSMKVDEKNIHPSFRWSARWWNFARSTKSSSIFIKYRVVYHIIFRQIVLLIKFCLVKF